MPQTANIIKNYLSDTKQISAEVPLFYSHSGKKLTRAGIAYILKKYVQLAREQNPVLYPDKVSPHTLRHSKGMHLLEGGVNLVYIRDFLGHSSITTTEIYYDKQILMTSCPGGYTVLLKYPPEQLSIINASIH